MKLRPKPLPASIFTKAGITLVELLIYMGLFMGFITILSGLFLTTLETQAEATANAHIDQDTWFVLSRLRYDFGLATNVVTPANNGDAGSTLTLDQSGTQVTYALTGNKLTITKNASTQSLISPTISASNLSFQRLGNQDGSTTIRVSLDLDEQARTQPKVVQFTLGLRP